MPKKPSQILTDKKSLKAVSKRLFDHTDKDKNGWISHRELEQLIKKLAQEFEMDPPTSSDIDDTWEKLDKNNDEKITPDEFNDFVVELLEALS